MDNLHRLINRTGEKDEELMQDLLYSAKVSILTRRFPYKQFEGTSLYDIDLEPQYIDLQYRIALDLYNKLGAEGETEHTANGIKRVYESSWISDQLLSEVIPLCGVTS